jgi:hypothetical protein
MTGHGAGIGGRTCRDRYCQKFYEKNERYFTAEIAELAEKYRF